MMKEALGTSIVVQFFATAAGSEKLRVYSRKELRYDLNYEN